MNEITMDLEIQRKLDESNEEWIFSYIMPFCENITQVTLKKEDVRAAMILWDNWRKGRITIAPVENEPMPEELRKMLVQEARAIRCPKCGRRDVIAAYETDKLIVYHCSDRLCDYAWCYFKEETQDSPLS